MSVILYSGPFLEYRLFCQPQSELRFDYLFISCYSFVKDSEGIISVKCPQCHFESPADTRFCSNCGAPLHPPEKTPPSHTKTLQTSTKELIRGSTFAGRYEIIEELGKGGMGKVYKVLDKEINEELALKLLRPEIAADEKTIERFHNELKYARKVTHKNVCRMHDLNKEEGIHYITMEYVPGEDLKSFIRRGGQLTAKKAVSIAKQMCEGLAEAHRLGVVHRDLKPQNIMIDKDGNTRIMDFGIARSLEAKGVTEAGMIIGTPDYMSPEQVEGEEADLRSDIYSLGVILYEMVIGRAPFEGDASLSIALKHKTEVPPDPSKMNEHVSEYLSAVILKCMEKERERRYQSVEELLSELERIEKGIETVAIPLKPKIPAFLIEHEEKDIEEERPVFVARDHELEKLNLFLKTALSGKGQVAFITGEAGSGKTALVQEFARRSQEADSELIVVQGKCNAQTGIGDPYLPFIEILRLLTGDVETKWTAGIIARDHATRLWNLLPLSANALLNKGPDLIDIFIPGVELVSRSETFTSGRANWLSPLKKLVERKAAFPADSSLQQSDLFEQYTRVLETLSLEKPLLLILDDLQWVDAGSASLLFHLGRRMAGSRIMILGAFRHSDIDLGRARERHPLEPILHEFKRNFGDLEIEVGKREGRQFVDAFLDSESNQLGPKFRDTLYKQTKGHSLFTVELLRDMQDRGVLMKDEKGQWVEGPDLDWNALPARVDAVVEERISRLTEELREVLTLASVEGEEFTAEVVARLQETEVRELIRLLSSELDKRHHLVSAKGIKHLERQRLSFYLFQHILFQRYLYNSLDEVEKAHLHEEVGNILESLYGEQADEIAVQLARHFEEGGIAPKAIEYLQKAGERASQLSAHHEAITHFNKCLHILKTLPDTPERAQQELLLQIRLAAPLQATKGLAAPEIGSALARAQELCQQLGDPPQLLTAMSLLAQSYSLRAEYRKTIELYKKIQKISEHAGDTLYSQMSFCFGTWSYLNIGNFSESAATAQRWIAVYDPEEHAPLAFVFGWDLGVIATSVGAWALWFLGYQDQAAKKRDDAVALARKLDHPHTLAFAITFDIVVRIYRRELQGVKELIEELIQLSVEKGFVYWEAHGIFYDGYIQSLEGQLEEGIAKMHQALDTLQAIGAGTCFTRLYTRIMEVYILTKQTEKGLDIYDKAMEVLHTYDERYCEAELYRVRGELWLLKAEDGKTQTDKLKKGKEKTNEIEREAESWFQKALEVSRKQKAKSLELRAAMSLSRLLQKQNKKEEARKILVEIYDWFTEGFDAGDLKEAKALLKELS
jgi:serine/threonine protein kinase/predicted ATPase